MKHLIIINHTQTGEALQRYLRYIKQTESTVTSFPVLNEKGTSSYLDYEIIIMEIYDESMINYGVQFGSLFEHKQKRLIYFFSAPTFKNGCTEKDLPENSFYLPNQLSGFLQALKNGIFMQNSSAKLMQILHSQPITSSH